ncbi:MAG: TolC family protein [Alphaproteobacteria bacterium]|nr:TolC family protein [Alphaproteobacteria bacterium]
MLLLVLPLAWSAEVQLELDDAVQRAWEAHADALLQAARVDAAEAAVAPERAPEDPQLRGRMENVGSRTDVPQWTLRLRQGFEPLGAIRARVRAAQAGAATEQADLEAVRAEVRAEVAALFDAARVLDAALAQVTAEREACDAWLDVVEKRRKAGVDGPEAVLEAQMARVAAVRRGVGVERDLQASRALLGALVGLDEGDVAVPKGPDLMEWVLAEAEEPGDAEGVVRARARLAEAEAEKRVASAERTPWIDWVEGQVVLESGAAPAIGIAAAASLPMFSLTDGAVKAADAEVGARRTALEAEERSDAARHAADRAAFEAASTAVRALSEAIDAMATSLEAERETLRPDRYFELSADLARERQELLEHVHDAAVARRAVERGVR